jgi:hypothetical protein
MAVWSGRASVNTVFRNALFLVGSVIDSHHKLCVNYGVQSYLACLAALPYSGASGCPKTRLSKPRALLYAARTEKT